MNAEVVGVTIVGAVAVPDNDKITVAVQGNGRAILPKGGIAVDLELATLGYPGAIVTLPLNAAVVFFTVRFKTLPDDDKIAIAVQGNGRIALVIGGIAVDLELAALGGAEAIIALPLNAVVTGITVSRQVTLPNDHKIAVTVYGNGRYVLIVGGIGVNLELAALGDAQTVIALRLDTEEVVAGAGFPAIPHHHKIAITVESNSRIVLVIGGISVDLKLTALRHTVGIK